MAYATTADGVRLYYQVSGAGEPLLLIPGQGADHRFWTPVMADFVDAFQVIVFDPRGTGNSDKPFDPPYSRAGSPLTLLPSSTIWGYELGHLQDVARNGGVRDFAVYVPQYKTDPTR